MDTTILPERIHTGWLELTRRVRQRTATRRRFISSAAASAGGLALWSLLPGGSTAPVARAAAGLPDLANWPSNNKIRHVVILCQENRSFDHYFGAFASTLGTPGNTALGFAPSELTYYDTAGRIITEAVVSEHPPAAPDMGQLLVSRVVQELMASSAWSSTALFVTYDEGGGYFEHVPPRILEYVPAGLPDAGAAVGPAFRVALFIVSPWAPANTVFKGTLDHTSILQFIERTFSTATRPITLSTIAPERRDLADLTRAFNFSQEPNIPSLPTPAQLYQSAQQTVLLLNLERTAADCSTNIPSWLLPLLGV